MAKYLLTVVRLNPLPFGYSLVQVFDGKIIRAKMCPVPIRYDQNAVAAERLAWAEIDSARALPRSLDVVSDCKSVVSSANMCCHFQDPLCSWGHLWRSGTRRIASGTSSFRAPIRRGPY